jgi:hypothetical protein
MHQKRGCRKGSLHKGTGGTNDVRLDQISSSNTAIVVAMEGLCPSLGKRTAGSYGRIKSKEGDINSNHAGSILKLCS